MKGLIIDVSYYQPNIDYQKVKDFGVEGVILRAGVTYWGAMVPAKDSCFEKHYEGFKNVGLPVGAYYYGAANTVEKAKEEADMFLSIIKGKQFELPVYYDTENNERQAVLPKVQLTEIVRTFCQKVEDEGYYVGIYASTSWLKNHLNMQDLEDFDVWVAHYGVSKPSYKGTYGMWQYTSQAEIPGINGRVDANQVYKDYPSIIKSVGLNGFEAENDDDDKIEYIDYELIVDELNDEILELEESLNKCLVQLNELKRKIESYL